MSLTQFFTIFIAIHAVSGMIALVAGTISVIAKKGGKVHKKSGKVFFYGMMLAGGSGIVASVLPGHYNPFLFVVGLFSIYLVLSGYRALNFTKVRTTAQLRPDIILAWTMIVVAVLMVLFGSYVLIKIDSIGIVLLVFGVIAFLNGYNDLKAFKDLKTLRKKAIRLHIGKISGGYIAAFTAFLVTNAILPSLLSWLLPTVFGIVFITYWLRKTRIKKKVAAV
jgi:uncharacterized membrane protein